MAYRYIQNSKAGPSGLDMTDIPGIKSGLGYPGDPKRDDSRSRSPPKFNSGKNAEMLSSDVIQINEDKVRKQISYYNKLGVSGPFIGFDKSSPGPKSPHIPMGTSAYKMQFSPGKQRLEMPMKLSDSSSVIIPTMSGSMRHMSNGDALGSRRNILSSSIDLGSSRKSKVKYAHNVSFDNKNDDFRFKKNLTSNADRILTKPGSYAGTPRQEQSSKFDEVRKHAQQLIGSNTQNYNNHSRGDGSYQAKTIPYGQENYNSHNVKDTISKPILREAAGTFNSSHLKRTMGIAPTDNVNFAPGASFAQIPAAYSPKKQFSESLKMKQINDPSYHRQQNMNNYGFDVVTGVRKNIPGSML
jgi:hypothetical protein